ncbi:MAG: hypothetical protein K9N23_05435 [Akkermansiaceae bacterium]|nr:hypothetical protein [Akkermansiaceae bacterium]MCF7731106.1 hypothetical protein [Akkermansiaceae bacterium]
MKMTIRFALFSAAFALLSVPSAFAEVDCAKLVQSIKKAVAADSSVTLQVVEKEITANPGCACEVVKAAIEGSNADAKLVAAIVETASTAAPQHMRLISQCAVAVAPDALANVQTVLAKLDPNSGESAAVTSTAKDAKGPVPPAVVAANPLDFPGSGVGDPPVRVGNNPGGPGGMPILPWGPPPTTPPGGIVPPVVTDV